MTFNSQGTPEEIEALIEASLKKRGELPEWCQDEPEILEVEGFYLEAFSRLSTCRQLGMSPGPIPWRDIRDYAIDAGLDWTETGVFTEIIHTMDSAWLEWQRKHSKTDG